MLFSRIFYWNGVYSYLRISVTLWDIKIRNANAILWWCFVVGKRHFMVVFLSYYYFFLSYTAYFHCMADFFTELYTTRARPLSKIFQWIGSESIAKAFPFSYISELGHQLHQTRHQTITWTSADLLSFVFCVTNWSDIWMKIKQFPFNKVSNN